MSWRRVLAALSVAAGVGVMVLMMVRTGTDIRDALTIFPLPAHLLALAGISTDVLGRGTRIWLIGRSLGVPIRWTTGVAAQIGGDGAAAVTPSRSGAEPAKAAVLKRDGAPLGQLAAVLLGEVVSEGIVVVVLGVALALAAPSVPGAAVGALAYSGISVGGAVALYLVARSTGGEPPALWTRLGLGTQRWRGLRGTAVHFVEGVRRLRRLPAWAVSGVLLVTLVHILGRLAILPALLGPHLQEGDTLAAAVVWPFVLLYVGALLPPPGGGGMVEAGFAVTLYDVLPPGVLGAALLWWRVYTFYLTALLGGLVLLWLGGRVWRRGRVA